MNPPGHAADDLAILRVYRGANGKIVVICQAGSAIESVAGVLTQGSKYVLGTVRHLGKTSKQRTAAGSRQQKLHVVITFGGRETPDLVIHDEDTVSVYGFTSAVTEDGKPLMIAGDPVSRPVKPPAPAQARSEPFYGSVNIDHPPSDCTIPVDGFVAIGTHDESSATGKLQGVWLNNLTPDFLFDEDGVWSAQFPTLTPNGVYHLLVVLTETKAASSVNLTAK